MSEPNESAGSAAGAAVGAPSDGANEHRPVSSARRWGTVVGAAACVLLLDQLSKNWAVDRLKDQPPIKVFWTLRFVFAENTGMAFSKGAGRGPLIGLIALCIVGVVAFSARRMRSTAALVLAGVIIGGALGNVIDRATRVAPGGGRMSGAVVDFIDFQWWPVFNVADAAVVVGGIALALVAFRDPDELGMTDDPPAAVDAAPTEPDDGAND